MDLWRTNEIAQVDLWVGLGAAVAGSGVGAFGAWGGNLVVERRRENLQLLGAIEMLQLELEENADRLAQGASSAALPLGVWEQCRPTLAGVGRRAIDQQLWSELNKVYRRIYDARDAGRFPTHPEPLMSADLEHVLSQLRDADKRFNIDLKSPRYWLRPEPNRRDGDDRKSGP